jgi:hypothetical protein
MVELGGSFDGAMEPINSTSAIHPQEIEADIRERVSKYEGEELINSLVEYMVLTMIEIEFTADPNPRPLSMLKGDKVQSVKQLTELLPD